MLENVNLVETLVSTNGKTDNDLITVPRQEYVNLKREIERLKIEREEYRQISLDLAEFGKNTSIIQADVEETLAGLRGVHQ